MRLKVKLRYLRRGDFFYIGGAKYKVLSDRDNRSQGNVRCIDVMTMSRRWLDPEKEVVRA